MKVVKITRSARGKTLRLTCSGGEIAWVTNEGEFLQTPPRGLKTENLPLQIWWEGNRIRKRKFYGEKRCLNTT